MELFVNSLKDNSAELKRKNICIRFIGDRTSFSKALQQQISDSEALTADSQLMNLNIAANYGGRWDILQAVKSIAQKVASEEISADQIDYSVVASALSLANTPDPDLFIRTGGEQRISNFMLWQLAYAELYFTDVLWPDFSEREMQLALDVYSQRQRRYGKTGEQVSAV